MGDVNIILSNEASGARRCPVYFLGEMIREREKVVPLPLRNFLSISS